MPIINNMKENIIVPFNFFHRFSRTSTTDHKFSGAKKEEKSLGCTSLLKLLLSLFIYLEEKNTIYYKVFTYNFILLHGILFFVEGENFEESLFNKVPFFKCQYNFANGFCSYFMNERERLLTYADLASEIAPSCFTGLYKV